jgi:acetyl esterase/lipase
MCRLDVLAPEGADGLPCFLWLHGGGLTGGDKQGEMAPCRVIAAEGFVMATANYRLHPAVTYPAYVEDAAAAVAWFRQHAGEYGGDADRLFIGGYSAGAYLAALIATDGRYLARHSMTPQQIRGLVLLSGAMATHFTVRAERGIPESVQVVDEAAPLYHAGKETPPWLALWGSNDKALRAEENLYLAGVLKAAGHDGVKVLQIEGRDHGTIAAEIENPEDPVRREILGFLKSAVGC